MSKVPEQSPHMPCFQGYGKPIPKNMGIDQDPLYHIFIYSPFSIFRGKPAILVQTFFFSTATCFGQSIHRLMQTWNPENGEDHVPHVARICKIE